MSPRAISHAHVDVSDHKPYDVRRAKLCVLLDLDRTTSRSNKDAYITDAFVNSAILISHECKIRSMHTQMLFADPLLSREFPSATFCWLTSSSCVCVRVSVC